MRKGPRLTRALALLVGLVGVVVVLWRGPSSAEISVATPSEVAAHETNHLATGPASPARVVVPNEGLPERRANPTPGRSTDLGSVVKAAGTILRGRVVDTDGLPVAGVTVAIRVAGAAPPLGDVPRDAMVSEPDGRFVGKKSGLAAGDYTVFVPLRRVVSPDVLTVTGQVREQVVDIVLASIDLTTTLSGVVMDEGGAPIAMATVRPVHALFGPWTMFTDALGRFVMTRRDEGSAGVRLHAEHHDYDVWSSDETFAWGRHDLRVVLRRGHELEVTVVTGGRPVGDFAVRVFPRDNTAGTAATQVRARGRGEGPVVVSGVRRGPHLVHVTPSDAALAMSAFVPVDVSPGRTRVTVILDSSATRTVRARRSDGQPLVGASLQLVDAQDRPGRRWVSGLEQGGGWSANGSALRLQTAVTDGDGEALLRGPVGRRLVVWFPGPGHAPTWVDDVRLDVATPLLLTVAAGGRVVGSVGPRALLETWRLAAGLPGTGALHQLQQPWAPAVVLRRIVDGAEETHPAQPVLLGDAGSFAMADVPAGSWRLVALWARKLDGRGGARETVEAATVEVRADATVRLDVDLSHLLSEAKK